MLIFPAKRNVKDLMATLHSRLSALSMVVEGRELKSAKEGCKGGAQWVEPGLRVAIEKATLEIAVDDFKTVLAQIRKIK